MRGGREMCCDCGLVHCVDYRVKDGVIEQKVSRDQSRTYAARRRLGIKDNKEKISQRKLHIEQKNLKDESLKITRRNHAGNARRRGQA